jgi:hypothetical protein
MTIKLSSYLSSFSVFLIPSGRQLVLGDNLDTEHIEANYDAGVLRLRIPVAEQAKPRKISIGSTNSAAVSAWFG